MGWASFSTPGHATCSIILAPTSLSLVEGGTGSYEVALSREPVADVILGITARGETKVDLAALTFTPETWDTPQKVTGTITDDDQPSGPRTGRIAHAIISDDPLYDALTVGDVTVNISDDDVYHDLYLPLVLKAYGFGLCNDVR